MRRRNRREFFITIAHQALTGPHYTDAKREKKKEEEKEKEKEVEKGRLAESVRTGVRVALSS